MDCSAEITMHSLRISSEVRPSDAVGVLLHLGDDELLIERAAVDADANRLAQIARDPQMVANCSSRRLPVPTLPGLMRYLSSACAQSG